MLPQPPPPHTHTHIHTHHRDAHTQVKIINKEGLKEANREEDGYLIKDGIVVIVKNAHIPSGTVI